MAQVRVKGYVVGYDKVGDELLWTVRVKDPTSAHNGKKFSVHSGTLLTKPAVDVTFKIESFQVGEEKILKATDVRLAQSVQVEPEESSKSGEVSSDTLGVCNFIVVEFPDGSRQVYVSDEETLGEAQRNFDDAGGDEKVVELVRVDANGFECEEGSTEIVNAFEILKAMSYVEHTRDAIESLLTVIYRLGQKGT